MKLGSVLVIIAVLAGLYWLYSANPWNIFQRS